MLSAAPPSKAKLAQFFKQPNDSQKLIIGSTAKEILCGGAFGAGKTLGCLIKGILICKHYPNSTGFIARETYPQLKDTVRKQFLEWVPPQWGKFIKTDGPGGTYYFTNGSEILFRHFDKMSEKDLKSLNLSWAFIDQGEDVPEATYLVLLSRLRQPTVPKTQVFMTANPKPGWLKRRFIDPEERGEKNPNRLVVNVTTYDNAHNLPADYIPTLIENYSEAWINRYVKASWEAFEGLVFPDFSRVRHVIKSSEYQMRPGRLRTLVLDWGMRTPTHANIFETDEYDNHVVIAEYRDVEKSIPEYAEAILRKFKPFFPLRGGMWGDPSLKQRTEKDKPTREMMFAKAGLPLAMANNHFDSGWALITKWLKTGQYKVLDCCIETIQEFEEWEWDDWTHLEERNLKEQPKDLNNHSMDTHIYYGNLHPEHKKRKMSSRPDSYKDIIEKDNPPEIDPVVCVQARDQEARDYFKRKRRKPRYIQSR